MQEYEVALVIEGYLNAEYDEVGEVECNGLNKCQDNHYHLRDGRLYFTVCAESPQAAYEKAVLLFDTAYLGAIILEDCKLEHVSHDDTYWYEEDLRRIRKQRRK